MSNGLAHAAHLPVTPFTNSDHKHAGTIALVEIEQRNLRRQRPFTFEWDAFAKQFDGMLVWHAGHVGFIGSLDAVSRMHEHCREVAVVGEQQQPLGVIVEPAYRVDVLTHATQQIDNRCTALWIRSGSDVSDRFVEQNIAKPFWGPDAPAVYANVIQRRGDLRAHLAYAEAIHGDAALGNQSFGGSAGGNASQGEDFLEALWHGKG